LEKQYTFDSCIISKWDLFITWYETGIWDDCISKWAKDEIYHISV